ncbi:hypothetical protein [Caloranaerobacter ferrireducens]|uniref:hypothetical protein n=1 Tax=Caloranaerobacter ferrireducens TaxID=1323370 RepID=UPI00084D1E33|nr:hypothetical protein [Caloranaerobacter ferrireducens]
MHEVVNIIDELYNLEEGEKELLEKKLELIIKLGCNSLIKNLETNRNKLDFITELNILYQLVVELQESEVDFELVYEEEIQCGSPDIKLIIDGVNYWIQVKRLNQLKNDAINRKVIKQISEELKEIKKNLFYSIKHSEFLEFSDVKPFIQCVFNNVDKIADGEKIKYKTTDGRFIQIEFYKPNRLKFKHLQEGSNMGTMRCVSDEINEHIRNSTKKALKSIGWNHDNNNINIIMAESTSYEDIDFGNAIFGDEQIIYNITGQKRWNRQGNGLISDPNFSEKLNYYVALYSVDKKLITNYEKHLFIISEYEIDKTCDLFGIDRIYYPDTYIDS